jgi:hypothetical protein
MSINLHDVPAGDLQALASQAEESALDGAVQIVGLAAPGKVEALYHAWRDVPLDDAPNRADAFGALAMLIGDYISAGGEQCPHCRRVEAARIVALAHAIIEGRFSDNLAVN